MGERIRDFSVRHTILFCIAVEIAGLAALIIFGGIIVLALPEADYYIQMLLQETAAAALAWWMMKVCGMGDVVKKKGYGFASGLLAGMYFLVIGIYSLVVFLFLGLFTVAVYPASVSVRPWYLILPYVLCMMMVGVFEEFLFRGIIAGKLLRRFGATSRGVWKAVILSGVLFGCAHLINLRGSSVTGVLVQCAVTVMMGMAFTAVYFRSGCIWAPAFLHGFVDVAAGSLTGVFDTGTTIAGTVSAYTPIQLLGAIPYIIVLLVILRPAMMAEVLALWNRREHIGPTGEEKTEKAAGKTGREE